MSFEVEPRVRRLGAGSYDVTDGVRTVHITRLEHLNPRYGQWVARAEWDSYLYSDPEVTLREAKDDAIFWLRDDNDEQGDPDGI